MSETAENDRGRYEEVAPALIETISDQGAVDLASDYGELAFDCLLDDGPLKDIPVVGTIVKLAKVGVGVRDYLFLKKVARFLQQTKNIPEHERAKLRSRVEADEKYRFEVGEKLVLLLERADDMEKPDLIGKAFAAYLREEVDLEQFTRMAAGIDRALMSDLAKLSTIQNQSVDGPLVANLVPSGLVQHKGSIVPLGGIAHTIYGLSDIGRLVLEKCLS